MRINHRFGKVPLHVMLLATVGMVAAACGSPSSEPDAGTSGSKNQACVAQAEKQAEKYMAEPAMKLPSATLDRAALKGKHLFYLTLTAVELQQEMNKGFKDAAEELGAKVTIFNSKAQAPLWTQGLELAVAQKVDGIVISAIDAALIAEGLAAAEKAGIKVIDVWTGQPQDALTNGLDAHVTTDFAESVRAQVAWVLKDSNCNANVAFIDTPSLPVLDPMRKLAPQLYKEQCSDCKFTIADLDIGAIATKTGPLASNVLLRDPTITYLQTAFDGLMTFVKPVMTKSDVKLISHDGIPPVLSDVKSGAIKMVVAQAPGEWMGWHIVDTLARAIAGQPISDTTIPTRLVDSTNIGDGNPFPSWGNYREKFTQAWGTGS